MNTIKARVRVNEYSNTHYFRTFNIIDELPEIGDYLGNETVKSVYKTDIDCENSDETSYYNYYEITTEKDDVENTRFVAVEIKE